MTGGSLAQWFDVVVHRQTVTPWRPLWPLPPTLESCLAVRGIEGQRSRTVRHVMKAIVQDRFGAPEVLELREVDKPQVGDGEVLVRVRAASVNPADWYAMAGTCHPHVSGQPAEVGMTDPRTILGQARQGPLPAGWRVSTKKRGKLSGFLRGSSQDPDPLLVITPDGAHRALRGR
jgi:hypothetical protein